MGFFADRRMQKVADQQARALEECRLQDELMASNLAELVNGGATIPPMSPNACGFGDSQFPDFADRTVLRGRCCIIYYGSVDCEPFFYPYAVKWLE